MSDFLTQDEKQVYEIIYNQCKRIGAPDKITTETLFRSILKMCDMMSLTNHLFDKIEPEKASVVIKSLIKKASS